MRLEMASKIKKAGEDHLRAVPQAVAAKLR
jgi:hypothetical protein